MNNHINKLLGIFIGAVIGAMIGYHMIDYSIYLMFIAPLIGGLSASLIIAPKTALDIIKKSFIVTFMEIPSAVREYVLENKDRLRKDFRLILYIIFYTIVSTSIVFITTYPFGLLLHDEESHICLGGAAGILWLFSLKCSLHHYDIKEGFFKTTLILLTRCNLPAWCFWIMYFTFKGIKHLIANRQKYIQMIIRATIYSLKFIARFSVRCESGLRSYGLALSVLSAAIGSFCGQFYSQSLYGGLIGIGSYISVHFLVWIVAIIPRHLPSRILQ